MRQRLRRLLPAPETLQRHGWLRWLGPVLGHRQLWHVSRRGVALGMALGVFFGLLVPIAQIPLAAGAAVVLRANVPAAVASTLVTNPLTFGPIYYAAWRLGNTVLGEPAGGGEAPPPEALPVAAHDEGWLDGLGQRARSVGKPLVVGLALMASGAGLATYLLVSWLWVLKVRWSRRRRHDRG